MKDALLHLGVYAPAAGANVSINPMDLGIDQPGFSNQWRLGRLRISWPAMPNFVSNADNITISLQDSPDGVTFANTGSANSPLTPVTQIVINGVATNGVAAGTVDMAIPPATRGPIGIYISASANAGNNTAALISADWVNE